MTDDIKIGDRVKYQTRNSFFAGLTWTIADIYPRISKAVIHSPSGGTILTVPVARLRKAD